LFNKDRKLARSIYYILDPMYIYSTSYTGGIGKRSPLIIKQDEITTV